MTGGTWASFVRNGMEFTWSNGTSVKIVKVEDEKLTLEISTCNSVAQVELKPHCTKYFNNMAFTFIPFPVSKL